MPFREAHEAVGQLVAWCVAHDVDLDEVGDAELKAINPRLTPEVRTVLSVRGALDARSAPGGTAPVRVREQLATLTERLRVDREWANGF